MGYVFLRSLSATDISSGQCISAAGWMNQSGVNDTFGTRRRQLHAGDWALLAASIIGLLDVRFFLSTYRACCCTILPSSSSPSPSLSTVSLCSVLPAACCFYTCFYTHQVCWVLHSDGMPQAEGVKYLVVVMSFEDESASQKNGIRAGMSL